MSKEALAKKIQAIEDREQIRDVVSNYGFLHDKLQLEDTRTNHKETYAELLKEWENQFTHDLEAVFSKGTRHGNVGMAATFQEPSPLLAFESGQWLGGGLMIWNQTEVAAEGRCTYHVAFVYERSVPDRHYTFGGFYDWKFAKVDGVWKISYIKPNTVWCSGADYAGIGPRDKQGHLAAFRK